MTQVADPHGALSRESLRHPDSYKWTLHPEDVIPMWIADMDFPVAPPIVAALQERLTRSLGYAQLSGDPVLKAALREHLAGHGLHGLSDEGIAFLPGVVPGIYAAVHALTTPGEAVVTMTPVYHPFHLSITDLGRRVAGVPLRDTETGYEINFAALDAASRGSRLLLLCHPHNPTGRVWSAEELSRLRELAVARDLFVVSDELHADLRYTGAPFEAFAADPKVRSRTLTLTGPCKAYNTAGLGIGAMVGHNEKLVARVRGAAGGLMGHESALSVTMWQAALREGGPWLRETLAYLRGNRDFLSSYLHEHLPWVRFHPAQSTYLAWLDLRAHPHAGDIQNFLLKEAKVAVHNGPLFAPEPQKPQYQGFVRLNFATSRSILEEALNRMRDALNGAM
ncbi:MalY/PatB family protein [Deinococcus deserti]|uniref:cysteine-S-conjugate beta-lyase n=1 Tax=Deinococcus deserti (strain DSM 17065 / CIP 109153 / LMG 22923 / VCD115) TaxID=546414 RepID=C1CVJ6_DEIDV|nr:MalY/PatB family protein [Deinococcus deserti]ACO46213.1 putative aminotransferase [Deinococcus deserti VCD115]